MTTYLTIHLRGSDRSVFLPGKTTHGHYQIELDCNACHTPGMGVKEQSCIDCHSEELKAVNDSHPKSKFTDPRNADRVKVLDARNCLTCHKEHRPEITHAMGVTLPDDYCFDCHADIGKERPSHKDFAFSSCNTSGCHNYHDNSVLYESFLASHLHEPANRKSALVPTRNLSAYLRDTGALKDAPPLKAKDANGPAAAKLSDHDLSDWETTAHARAHVNCNDCHIVKDEKTKVAQWTDKPSHQACAVCHGDEVKGFLGGLHGMRLAQNLSPMQPAMARLPMKPEAAHRELSCASCHGAHRFDSQTAAVESCLGCHNDSHTLAYQSSSHYSLWQAEQSGKAPKGSGVSCATCHLPREVHKDGDVARVLVQHNQNLNLRPNDKIIRSVCINCHGMDFTLDALADANLIRKNFNGRPSRHNETMKLVERRQLENKKKTEKE